MSYEIHRCLHRADAEYVVLIAGLGGHASFWQPQLEVLRSHYHVLCYDQEGCHATSAELPQVYSFKHLAEQLLRILDQEKIKQLHLIGHAIGSFIAAELAILAVPRIQIISLTWINAWDGLDPHTQKCFQTRRTLLYAVGAEAYLSAQGLFLYPAAWISQNYLQLKQLEAYQLRDFPSTHNVITRIEIAERFNINNLHLNALSNCRLHFIGNQDDFLVPVQKSHDLQHQFGHGQLSILNYGGHASTYTAPEVVNRMILQFLLSDLERDEVTMA